MAVPALFLSTWEQTVQTLWLHRRKRIKSQIKVVDVIYGWSLDLLDAVAAVRPDPEVFAEDCVHKERGVALHEPAPDFFGQAEVALLQGCGVEGQLNVYLICSCP